MKPVNLNQFAEFEEKIPSEKLIPISKEISPYELIMINIIDFVFVRVISSVLTNLMLMKTNLLFKSLKLNLLADYSSLGIKNHIIFMTITFLYIYFTLNHLDGMSLGSYLLKKRKKIEDLNFKRTVIEAINLHCLGFISITKFKDELFPIVKRDFRYDQLFTIKDQVAPSLWQNLKNQKTYQKEEAKKAA